MRAIDDVDHWILLRRNIGELQLEQFRRLAEPGEFLSDFVAFFSRCQDELVSCEDYQRYVDGLRRSYEGRKKQLEPDARRLEEDELARQEELARAYRVSERLLRENNLITFGAQLMQAVALLRSDAALLEQLREQYRYILVDEFQDTNIAQLELLYLLAGDRRNIVAVGDDDQAIYRFRGASFGSFTIFLKRFCGVGDSKLAAGRNKHLVSLTQNYRSTQRILRVAGEVISANEKSPLLPPKRLKTDNPDGERIRVAEFGTPDEEAHWVASEIERLHGPGNPWRNFAVLYRKHTHRDKLLEALRRRAIPFVIKRFSILSSTIVRDLLAYLRLIAVPSDNVACARVLAAPYWGLEPRDLVRLAERAEKNHRRPLSEELDAVQGELPFARVGTHLPELVSMLNRLRQTARRVTTSELLDELIRSLEVAPLPSDADHFYLERLAEFVKAWEQRSEGTKLRDFIEYLDFFEEANGDICLEDEPSDDAVQLMTVHSAKGLEFPHVFILHLNKRDFPSGTRPVMFEFPAELMKEEKPEGDFQIQEERRLFYVALTRARQRLTLSTIVNKFKKPSPFLDDFLMNPQIQKFDAVQSSPKVVLPPEEEVAAPAPDLSASLPLFAGLSIIEPRAYSRVALWAKSYHPPLGGAAAIERVGDRELPEMSDAIFVRAGVASSRWAKRGDDVWQRDAYDDQGICFRLAEETKSFARRPRRGVRTRMVVGGIFRRLSRRGVSQRRQEGTRELLAHVFGKSARGDVSGEDIRAGVRTRRDRKGAHRPGELRGARATRRGDRRLQDGKTERFKKSGQQLAAECVCDCRRGSAGAEAGAIGFLQFDDERSCGHDERREGACEGEAEHSGSGRQDSREGLRRETWIPLQVLRLRAAVPGARAVDFNSTCGPLRQISLSSVPK